MNTFSPMQPGPQNQGNRPGSRAGSRTGSRGNQMSRSGSEYGQLPAGRQAM